MPEHEAGRVTTLLFDLDDTVLTRGRLSRASYDALWDLSDAGVDLIAVTGRPSGWGEVIARQWPVLGVVTENGAVALHVEDHAIVRSMREGAAARRARLLELVEAIRARFPDLELADDNDARRTDVTFDVGERRKVDPARVDEVRRFVSSAGARSIVSSVHLHATLEGDDKASGALRFLRERRGLDAGAARVKCAVVGDSENDAACFAAFRTTVGVANVIPWVPRLSVPPRYVTRAPMGDGFAELARALVATRHAAPDVTTTGACER